MERADGVFGATYIAGVFFDEGEMKSVLNKKSRAEIGRRTKSAMQGKIARGERVSSLAPYGSAIAGDGVHLVPSFPERRIIGRILDLTRSGKTCYRIAKILAAEGVLNRVGTQLTAKSVLRIIRRYGRTGCACRICDGAILAVFRRGDGREIRAAAVGCDAGRYSLSLRAWVGSHRSGWKPKSAGVVVDAAEFGELRGVLDVLEGSSERDRKSGVG
ncbi:MAG: hypothetical protein ABIH23_16325 [bacterium]